MFTNGYGMSAQVHSSGFDHGSYFSRPPSSDYRPRKANPLGDTELTRLIGEIEQGDHNSVTLTERELSDHQFIRIIISSTARNAKVEEIDVSSNQIRSGAIRDLVPTLSRSNKIRILNLAHNEVNDESIGYFLRILQHNFTIICINLLKNPIISHNLARLSPFLDRNREIQRELMRSKLYLDILSNLDQLTLARPLINLILDYFNEATIPEARKVIAENLYSSTLSPSDGSEISLEKETEHLPDSVPSISLLSSHLQEVKKQYGNSSDKLAITMKESHTTLVFSGPPGITSKTKFCNFLSKKVKEKNKKRCKCVIL